MPLSEHEQRLLEQMERALYQEDPKFATSLRHGRSGAIDKRRVALGLGAAAGGLLLVLGGVASATAALGVAGFAAMVAGAWLVYTATQQRPKPESAVAGQPNASGSPSPSARKRPERTRGNSDFMSKIEERWRRRREGDH